jgi:hypothetical protein
MKLIVCLREPVERAFSAYLDGVKNGQIRATFEQALDDVPSLLDRGRYATHLRPYVETFGRDRIHVGVFDELRSDPDTFAAKLIDFLGIEQIELSPALRGKMMPAGRPRSETVVRVAKRASHLCARVGLKRLRGRVKRSRTIRNLLFRQYTERDKPVMEAETRDRLRRLFAEEVQALDELLGTDFVRLWQYATYSR